MRKKISQFPYPLSVNAAGQSKETVNGQHFVMMKKQRDGMMTGDDADNFDLHPDIGNRGDVDGFLSRFRSGDYNGYQDQMRLIGKRYDAEFAGWAQSATTAGQPPLPPDTGLPPCKEASPSYLGKNCSISGLSASGAAYATILLPAGARNLKLWTSGGSGDVDLYVALDRYPTPASYDYASAAAGNEESVSIPTPQTGRWYYLTLQARQPFANVSVSASYD
jgi:microbial collagenase